MEKISRAEAQRQGLKRYFTGKPCKHGHVSERWLSGACVSCDNSRREREKDRRRVYASTYYRQNQQMCLERQADYYLDNRDKIQDYRQRNSARIKEQAALYQRKHREYFSNQAAKRRAAKLNRTPPWADLEAIKQFYINCPKGMTVDHIIPLNGREVSGLHVLENLQYLTPSENSSKSNCYNPEKFPEQQLPLVTLTSLLPASASETRLPLTN